jgi:hypothetical protein
MSERSREILAWIGRQALEGSVPAGRDELLELLEDAGFAPEDVQAALDRARDGRPLDPPEARPMPVAQLSDDATHFLNVLRDLGYLDDAMEDEVLDQVMDEFADARRNVELDDLRRHVATVLFDRQYELEPETIRFLETEWRIAFH